MLTTRTTPSIAPARLPPPLPLLSQTYTTTTTTTLLTAGAPAASGSWVHWEAILRPRSSSVSSCGSQSEAPAGHGEWRRLSVGQGGGSMGVDVAGGREGMRGQGRWQYEHG